jgi:hypothetical protein
MKKLIVVAILSSLTMTAASARTLGTDHHRSTIRVKTVRPIQPVLKPANLPMPVDAFRA